MPTFVDFAFANGVTSEKSSQNPSFDNFLKQKVEGHRYGK
jgi:hypothetical protein